MALWLILSILQSFFICGILLGQCAKKVKKNGETSEKVKTKTPTKGANGGKGQMSKMGTTKPDDNGYENCDDMTNEELAKIAAKA